MSIKLNFQVIPKDTSRRYIQRASDAAHDAVGDVAEEATAVTHAHAPGPGATNQLHPGIEWFYTGHSDARVVSRAPHTEPLEYGSRPHDIPGSFGREFPWGHGAEWEAHFKKQLSHKGRPMWHPGNEPYGFMAAGADYAQSVLWEELAARWPK